MKQILVSAMILMFVWGCGDDGPESLDDAAAPPDAPVAGPDGAPMPDANPQDPDAGPPVCNALTNDATAITVRRSTTALPTPTGGTIVDGTYYLVSDVFHEAAADMDLGPEQGTAEYTGTTVQQIVAAMGEAPLASTSTFTLGGGTAISFTQTCPGTLDLRWDQYSTDGINLALHYTTVKRVQTFVRQ